MSKIILRQESCAKYFSVSRHTIARWVKEGCPTVLQKPSLVLLDVEDVRTWLESQPKGGKTSDSDREATQ